MYCRSREIFLKGLELLLKLVSVSCDIATLLVNIVMLCAMLRSDNKK